MGWIHQGHSPPKKKQKNQVQPFNHSSKLKKNHHPNFGSNRSDLMQLQFLSSNSLRCSDLCYGGEFAICRTHKETIELGSFVSFLKTLDGRTAEGRIKRHDHTHYDMYISHGLRIEKTLWWQPKLRRNGTVLLMYDYNLYNCVRCVSHCYVRNLYLRYQPQTLKPNRLWNLTIDKKDIQTDSFLPGSGRCHQFISFPMNDMSLVD